MIAGGKRQGHAKSLALRISRGSRLNELVWLLQLEAPVYRPARLRASSIKPPARLLAVGKVTVYEQLDLRPEIIADPSLSLYNKRRLGPMFKALPAAGNICDSRGLVEGL